MGHDVHSPCRPGSDSRFSRRRPDQPIVVGSVYNKQNMPHYDLPKYKTLSYIKTHSTPKHQGYNELRFEDKATKEQVFLFSQKRMDFRLCGSHYETCGGNRQETVGYHYKDGDEADHGGNLAVYGRWQSRFSYRRSTNISALTRIATRSSRATAPKGLMVISRRPLRTRSR